MKKIISILSVCFSLAITLSSQPKNEYVKVDRGVSEIILDDIVKKEGLEKNQIMIAKYLLNKAFSQYFEDNRVKAVVYEQSEVDVYTDSVETLFGRLDDKDAEIQSLKDNLKKKDVEICNVRKSVADSTKAEFRKQSDSLRMEIAKKEISLKKRGDSVDSLKRVMAQLQLANTSLSEKNDSLKRVASVADRFIKQHKQKEDALKTAYSKNLGSSIENVDVKQIESCIVDYRKSLKALDIPEPKAISDNIILLEAMANAKRDYDSAIVLFSNQLNQASVNEWVKKKKNYGLLPSMQQTVMYQVNDAVGKLVKAHMNFVNGILKPLEGKSQIPDSDIAGDIKGQLIENVKTFALFNKNANDPNYIDDTKYNSYYTHLNGVLEYTIKNMREMDAAEYKKYIDEIKKKL